MRRLNARGLGARTGRARAAIDGKAQPIEFLRDAGSERFGVRRVREYDDR